MDSYLNILSLFLWVSGCCSVPRPYPIGNSTSPVPRMVPISSSHWSIFNWTSQNITRRIGENSGVVFPSDSEDSERMRPIRTNKPTLSSNFVSSPTKPHACKSEMKFCEDNDYPTKFLDTLLKKSGEQFIALFGSDLTDTTPDESLVPRIDNTEDSPLCQSTQNLIHPKKGEDINGNTRYIINHGNFTQGIRTETCTGENVPCAFSEVFPSSYVTSCHQKHIYRKLAALNDDNDVEWMFFPIPSCCVCMYRFKLTRSG